MIATIENTRNEQTILKSMSDRIGERYSKGVAAWVGEGKERKSQMEIQFQVTTQIP